MAVINAINTSLCHAQFNVWQAIYRQIFDILSLARYKLCKAHTKDSLVGVKWGRTPAHDEIRMLKAMFPNHICGSVLPVAQIRQGYGVQRILNLCQLELLMQGVTELPTIPPVGSYLRQPFLDFVLVVGFWCYFGISIWFKFGSHFSLEVLGGSVWVFFLVVQYYFCFGSSEWF